MLMAGVDAKRIAEFMGDADPGLVWTRYSHVLRGGVDDAVAVYDDYKARAAGQSAGQ
jgi:hypothetical protein